MVDSNDRERVTEAQDELSKMVSKTTYTVKPRPLLHHHGIKTTPLKVCSEFTMSEHVSIPRFHYGINVYTNFYMFYAHRSDMFSKLLTQQLLIQCIFLCSLFESIRKKIFPSWFPVTPCFKFSQGWPNEYSSCKFVSTCS